MQDRFVSGAGETIHLMLKSLFLPNSRDRREKETERERQERERNCRHNGVQLKSSDLAYPLLPRPLSRGQAPHAVSVNLQLPE